MDWVETESEVASTGDMAGWVDEYWRVVSAEVLSVSGDVGGLGEVCCALEDADGIDEEGGEMTCPVRAWENSSSSQDS